MENQAVTRQHSFSKNAVYAGLIGGAIFMMAEMLMVMMIDQSPFGPLRMIAAMALGPEVLPPPATFDIGIMMTAMMIHFPLSIIYAIILALIIKNMVMPMGLLVGGLFGLAIYLVNFYGIASLCSNGLPWCAIE